MSNSNPRIKPNIACKECGVSFHARGTKQRFCSHPCWIIYKTRNKLGTRKGILVSQETILKIKESKKIWHENNIPWNRGKKLANRSGDKHFNWKGGITPSNLLFRKSLEYKQWRTSVFTRDNFTCQMCSSNNCRLHADHIKPFASYPELRLDINNGRTLCVKCHIMTPTYGARRVLC